MNLTLIEPDWPAPERVLAFSTTRAGGVSSGPWSSLNLATHVQDDPASVAENRCRLEQYLPRHSQPCWLQQVHGVAAVEAGQPALGARADGVWSRAVGVPCAVLTADCLPVLFCDDKGQAVAAAHAGWRGLAAGVLETTVRAMQVAPEEVMAWLGPAIGPEHFEVGPEVREALLARTARGLPVESCFIPSGHRPGHFMADLYGLARARLAALGLNKVYGGDLCTYRDKERFFSYRRDGATGRMATLICRL
ncbi:MAG: peptidoglycan editing factor PgeF [Pseudomonadota bacterium]